MFAQLQKACQSMKPSIRGFKSVRQWRKDNNAPKSRLGELPDWSYVDGRGFCPPSIFQKNRYIRDQELAATVVRRFKELETAKNIKP